MGPASTGSGVSPLGGIRVIAIDLDGTLLPASKRLTDRARRVIGELRAAGLHVTLATGRGWPHTQRYAQELGLTEPVVALEGALVARTSGDAIHCATLPHATLRHVQSTTAGLDLGFFYCHSGRRTLADKRLEPFVEAIRIWDPDVDLIESLPADPEHDPFVFHLVGPPDPIEDALARLADDLPPDVDLVHAPFWDGHHQLQVRPSGTSKEGGLEHVLRELGATKDELLACGDWWNDVEMLDMAAVAVVPGDAVDGVKERADYVLAETSEEDAVIAFLEDALKIL